MRPQRRMWIAGAARTERVSLGRGWQVRLALLPWRSKIPVRWSAPVVGRRVATVQEVSVARALTPGWPQEEGVGYADGFVLEFADGTEWTAPLGYRLVLQRIRSPQREQEMKQWRFT